VLSALASIPSKFDAIVVGAGPAGSAAAYTLAKEGFKTLLIDRGRGGGEKELFGGRVYAQPLRDIWPELDKEAPIQRWVTRERISFVKDNEAVTVEFKSPKGKSFTAFLPQLTSWMARKAEQAGALYVNEVTVDEIIFKDGRAVGVRSGSDTVEADVIIDAEGVNRLLLERAGLVERIKPDNVALGVKEILRTGSTQLEASFGIDSDEGAAWVVIGDITKGVPGGGFIYTNKDTVSMGIVLHLKHAIDAIEAGKLNQHVSELVEGFRLHPYFRRLWRDATISEYGAHLTIEGGLKFSPKRLAYPGLLVVGDAAGLLLTTGINYRGVDFAAYSGKLAAEAIKYAMDHGGFTYDNLRVYDAYIRGSFVYTELQRHLGVEMVMNDPAIFAKLPNIAIGLFKELYEQDYATPTPFEALTSVLSNEGLDLFKLLSLSLSMVMSL
jgi:electron transfer flavoprotein-quinone oxidoreductase